MEIAIIVIKFILAVILLNILYNTIKILYNNKKIKELITLAIGFVGSCGIFII